MVIQLLPQLRGSGERYSDGVRFVDKGAACCAPTKTSGNERRLARGGGDGRVYRREPVVAVGLAATGEGEKLFLKLSCDRAGNAFADLNAVHGTNGGDFHRGTNQKDFVRDIKHFSRNDGLLEG